jgi:Putative Actinobacterial Holin-X, holin superfamily III
MDKGVAEFIDDLMSLAELQTKLAAANLHETACKAALPLVLSFLGLTLAAGSLLVFLFGSASLLATRLNIHGGWAMIMVAIAAAALGSPIAAFALVRLRQSFATFRTSHDELRRNLAWVRSVVGARNSS